MCECVCTMPCGELAYLPGCISGSHPVFPGSGSAETLTRIMHEALTKDAMLKRTGGSNKDSVITDGTLVVFSTPCCCYRERFCSLYCISHKEDYISASTQHEMLNFTPLVLNHFANDLKVL